MAAINMQSGEERLMFPPQQQPKKSLSSAPRLLEPIARVALRQGITAHEFARWVEVAFVHAAIDVLNEQGKDLSFSRISAATGIHRHAVSSILGGVTGTRSNAATGKEYQRHRLARVLTGWFENPVFTDSNGRPLPLPLEGDAPSFAQLVREYSGDIYPGIILDELIHVGAAKMRQDGSVEALSRRFTSGGVDEASIEHACTVAADILRTVERNMKAAEGDRLFEDSAIALQIPPEAIPRLARLLERRAGAFLDDLEGWFSELQQSAATQPGKAVRAGVRIVMIADNPVEPDGAGEDGPKPAASDD